VAGKPSSEGEQHLATSVAAGSVGDRFAVIRERVGRLDLSGEGAVGDEGCEDYLIRRVSASARLRNACCYTVEIGVAARTPAS
jgi:hypothetical protein